MVIPIFQKKEKTFMNHMKALLILKQIMNIDKHKRYCHLSIMSFQGMLKSGIKESNPG